MQNVNFYSASTYIRRINRNGS